MSSADEPTGYLESPVYFDAGGESLFGILTRPRSGVAQAGFIILPGGATPLTTNRNRLSVRICRELASRGLATIRIDYHGTGESTGSVDQFRLDRPFVEDVSAAIDLLKAAGARDVLVAGSCFGGRTALAAAATVPGVRSVMLLATSPRDYLMGERVSARKAATWSLGRYVAEAFRPRALRGWFDRRLRRTYLMHARSKLRLLSSRLPGGRRRLARRPMGTDVVSPHFARELEAAVDRGIQVVLVYGTEDGFHREFLDAAAGPLAPILRAHPEQVEVRLTPGRMHGFTSTSVQDAAFEEVVAWAAGYAVDGRSPAVTSAGRGGSG